MNTDLVKIQEDITKQLANKEVARALLDTTFKGLSEPVMKQALMEGMMRGFEFKDFLEKNIYAVPFKDGYSLITSIDQARKIGARSGVVGKSEPKFTETEDGKVETCTITIKKQVGETIGEFTETVYFSEYYKAGKNGYASLWDTKPRTMISKVAEMHALRMACPEELAKSYVEEEFQADADKVKVNVQLYREKLEMATNMDELKSIWSSFPGEAREINELVELKDSLKKKYENA